MHNDETEDDALGLNLVRVLVYRLEFSLLSLHSILNVAWYRYLLLFSLFLLCD